jgi:hypothetical protein
VKRLLLVLAVVVAVLLQPTPVSAAWRANGTGQGTAKATEVEKASAPTVAPAGSAASISWAPVMLRTGQPASGYVVLREVGAQTTQVCTTTGARTCTDAAPVAGSQTYKVFARFGPWTGPVSNGTSYTPDTQPPTTTATPDGSSPVNTNPTRVTLSATDTGSGVAFIRYRVDSGAWITVNSDVAAFDVVGQGTKTITYRATDNLGNEEAIRTLVLNIDAAAPSAPTFWFLAEDSGTWLDRITNVADNGVIGRGEAGATVEIRRSGALVGSGTVSGNGWFNVSVALVDGTQQFSITLVDAAGNVSPASTVSITLDRTPPVVTVKLPTGTGQTAWNNACGSYGLSPGICGTATDSTDLGQVTYEVRRINGSSQRCWDGDSFEHSACGTYRDASGESPWRIAMTYSALQPATYEIRIRVTDEAGNTNDTTAPTAVYVR